MTTNSQVRQDLFALALSGPWPGVFLDIGAGDPISTSNTYLLESHGWTGLCIDRRRSLSKLYAMHRKTKLTIADSRRINYQRLCKKMGLSTSFTYLSLDVDDATVPTLERLLAHGIYFHLATIEHDAYRLGDGPRAAIRRMMEDSGYTLIRKNVHTVTVGPFEDWWIKL